MTRVEQEQMILSGAINIGEGLHSVSRNPTEDTPPTPRWPTTAKIINKTRWPACPAEI